MKKIMFIFALLLLSGCSDPFTDNIENRVDDINKINEYKNIQNAENYINNVRMAYMNYITYNGNAPSDVSDLNMQYDASLDGICETDINKSDYAIKLVNGYIQVHCGKYASYEGIDMPIK